MWLCKQPSLTEGLDNLSSDEEENDRQSPEGDATIRMPQADTGQSSEEADQNQEEEQDDVFTHDINGDLDNELDVSERNDRSSSTEPPQWLVRAISICSEGEDLEVLASEADEEELGFPEAFSDDYSYHDTEEQSTDEDLSRQEEDESSCYPCSDSLDDRLQQQNTLDTSESLAQDSKTSNSITSVVHENGKICKAEIVPDKTSHSTKYNFPESSCSPKDSSSAGTADDRQSFTSSGRDSGKNKVMRQRTISDLANICIDPKESDYLYAAGHTIHKALQCEVSGKYDEAFSLYKTCVGLLLSGVQGKTVLECVTVQAVNFISLQVFVIIMF